MLLALALVVGIAGCSNDGGGALGGGDSVCKTPAASGVPGAPVVTMPSSRPVDLVRKDLKVGTGTTATAGSTVTVQFVGVACTTGAEVDTTWGTGQPYTASLVKGKVIAGWLQGLPGMKVGGRRELVVPPTLGYGDAPPPGFKLAAGETLVFVVDLVSVT
jgi:peptidylprolyl isomerase